MTVMVMMMMKIVVMRVRSVVSGLLILGCSEPAAQEAGSSEASTGEVSTTDAGSSTGQPPEVCETAATCACGTLGCPCGPGFTCSEGACNTHTRTCTQVEDGMVRVPAGPFWMGCREGVDTDAHSDPCPAVQLPYREVTVDAFWIDRTEVTKGAFRACMEAGVCAAPPLWDEEWYQGDGEFKPGREDMPAASVTWSLARTYCAWVGKRLPSDAEWEKAARGTDGRKYPWGMEEPTCEHANFMPWDIEGVKPGPACPYRDEFPNLTPVTLFCGRGASPYGACEMAGSVAEWAADGYESGVGYGDLPAVNPLREPNGKRASRRGSGWGGWSLGAGGYSLRTSQRWGGGTDTNENSPGGSETLEQGFRCARSG